MQFSDNIKGWHLVYEGGYYSLYQHRAQKNLSEHFVIYNKVHYLKYNCHGGGKKFSDFLKTDFEYVMF